jgi:hypothetical protein
VIEIYPGSNIFEAGRTGIYWTNGENWVLKSHIVLMLNFQW